MLGRHNWSYMPISHIEKTARNKGNQETIITIWFPHLELHIEQDLPPIAGKVIDSRSMIALLNSLYIDNR